MPIFLIHHVHSPSDCAVASAAWSGVSSPLRGSTALSSCLDGGHGLWWSVEADDSDRALAQLPAYLAKRAEAIAVREVEIP